jgi:hypothetical protein
MKIFWENPATVPGNLLLSPFTIVGATPEAGGRDSAARRPFF